MKEIDGQVDFQELIEMVTEMLDVMRQRDFLNDEQCCAIWITMFESIVAMNMIEEYRDDARA